ncbi:unnamed protein product [Sphagnum balticum]
MLMTSPQSITHSGCQSICMWCKNGGAFPSSYVLRLFVLVLDDLKYAESHEWVKLEGDYAVVGITHHAQGELGDVVFVDLPEVGRQVSKGEPFGVVESVKAASDIYSPISGEIVAVNSELAESPALVNKGPFDEGWIMKVKLKDREEIQSLLDAEKYKQHVEESAH